MKRLLAILLTVCIILSLGACAKPADQNPAEPTVTESTTQTVSTVATETVAPTAPTEPGSTIGTVAHGSLEGKSITIYGLGVNDPQADYGNYYDEAYKRMMRTAADEWAAINGVTIKYCGAYDQNTLLAALGSGDNVDIIIQSNSLGLMLEIGLATAFTETEYNTLAALTRDNRYLDILDRKGKSYGMVLPWAGNLMVYFNQSLFAKYDVKSPLEYYNEDAWTWENLAKCMTEISRDLNGDGTTDIYGLPGDSWANLVNTEKRDDVTGKLLSVLDDPWIQDFIQMKYDAYQVTGSSQNGENNIETNGDSPMYAMQISPCETYDPQDVFKVTSNGDTVIAVPLPRWEGKDGESKEWVNNTQMTAHIGAFTKEREATFDLLCYLTKCGMKYMADCSLGTISCDYTGIQGTIDASKQWKEIFDADVQQRKEALEKLSCYDAAYVPKLLQELARIDEWYVYTPYNTYNKYFNFLNCMEICEKPPTESIPLLKEDYLAALESYNKMYYPK